MIGMKTILGVIGGMAIIYLCLDTVRHIPTRFPASVGCSCPYDKNGSCGGRSAHSSPGGYEPVCYLGDHLWMQRDLRKWFPRPASVINP